MGSSSRWLWCLLLWSGNAWAEVRTSATYEIGTDVTDSAGGKSTSAIYANTGSLGGLTGAATVSQVTNHAGYVAQTGDTGAPVSTVVTSLADSGPGSLRAVLAATAMKPGPDIVTFATELSGGTISLTSQIMATDTGGVTINATALQEGITVSGGGVTRIMQLSAGASVDFIGVTLTGGTANGGHGGAVFNDGTLVLERCTVTANNAPNWGGGIYNNMGGTLTITSSTITGNSAGAYGGGLENLGNLSLRHVTLAANTAGVTSGGIDFDNASAVTIAHTIIAGNTASSGRPDLGYYAGSFNVTGPNLIGNNQSAEAFFPAGALVGTNALPLASLLAPLGDYGGPTSTLALLPDSPARNAAAGSSATADQRGFSIVGAPDLGAYEAGTFATYDIWIWESLPAGATVGQHAMTADFDGDGATNGAEWLALTDPSSGSSFFAAESITSGANLIFSFPTAPGRTYRLRQTDDLVPASWIDAPGQSLLTGDGTLRTFIVPKAGVPRRFFEIVPLIP